MRLVSLASPRIELCVAFERSFMKGSADDIVIQTRVGIYFLIEEY
jgi:hypothetical protein